ncbi:hypothetical protein [Kordiimonas pumila]|uniref:Uncharacterized protein n=1 Tax=Kordiimonas pumila TaxID=2161677 RepID=A0ABV7D5J9_9PROT|nr:hypothetical protein [Kordiimonas pumila]
MLWESFIWATSSSVPYARSAGLTTEIAGIAGRYKRHKASWQTHLEKSKQRISLALEHADSHKPCLVMGAGLCLDIPLEHIAQHPAGCVLIDAVLPLTTRLKLLRYRAIDYKLADITGFLAPFWSSIEGDEIPAPTTAPLPLKGYACAISLNILSQLPLPFAGSPPSGDTECKLTAAIQKAHMDTLLAMDCPVLLITDYDRRETTGGTLKTIPTVAPHLLPGNPDQSWIWDIAPLGETGPNQIVQLKVGSWYIEK